MRHPHHETGHAGQRLRPAPAADPDAAARYAAGEVAGYRLVRVIGRGRRCVVYLGHPSAKATPTAAYDGAASVSAAAESAGPHPGVAGAGAGTAGRGPAGAGDGGIVAVKVFDTQAAHHAGDEAALLTAARSEHIPTLADFAWLPGGRGVVVQQWVPGPTVTAWLDGQPQITPGQATTLGVGILRAEAALQEAGHYSRNGVSPSRFRLDAHGRPMLVGLGTVAPLAGPAETGDDTGRGVRALVRSLAQRLPAHVRDDWMRRLIAAWEHLADQGRAGMAPPAASLAPAATAALLRRMEDAFFSCAPAEPVVPGIAAAGVPAGGNRAPESPGRCVAAVAPDSGQGMAGGAVPGWAQVRPGLLYPGDPVPVGSPAAGILAAAADRLRAARSRLGPMFAAHRRPLVVAAVLAGLLSVLAVTALPLRSAADPAALGAEASRPAAGAPRPAAAGEATAEEATAGKAAAGKAAAGKTAAGKTTGEDRVPKKGGQGGEEGRGAGASGGNGTGARNSGPAGAVPADPAQAALALVRAREGCLAGGSSACIDLVDEPGSPQSRADRAFTAAALDYTVRDLGGAHATLVQRNGATALVTLSRPGGAASLSVLLIKTASGWAVREIFD